MKEIGYQILIKWIREAEYQKSIAALSADCRKDADTSRDPEAKEGKGRKICLQKKCLET